MATSRERLEELRALKAQQQNPKSRLEQLRQIKAQQLSQLPVSQISPTGQIPSQQPEQLDSTFGQKVIGGVEGAAALGTGAIADVVGGLVGLIGSSNPFESTLMH